MPEINTKTGFPVPPAAKPLSPADMQAAFNTQMEKAAKAIGGTVLSKQEVEAEAPAAKKTEYTYPVDAEDKKRYIRSLLAGEKFSKRYDLFGGKMQVQFRTRTTEELYKLKTVDTDDKFKAKMTVSLVTLTVVNNARNLNDLDDVAYAAVCESFSSFEELCDELYRRANDPDFWTETVGRA